MRQKLCLLGHVLLTVLAVFFSATAPVLFTDSAGVNPRVIYALGGLHGILLVYLVWLMRASDTAQGRRISAVLRPAAAVLLCLFLTVQVFSFQRVITDKHSNTELDKYRCLMIGERIGAYEAESGVEVKSIAVVRHGSPQYDLFSSGSMVVSAFKHSWSAVAAINYFCNTDFTRVTCPARIIEYFSKLDWDTYSDSQLLFEGDTLYLCVY